MSMTKRYLESLPEEEQDAILGVGPEDNGIDPDYEEWLASLEANADEIDADLEAWWAERETEE